MKTKHFFNSSLLFFIIHFLVFTTSCIRPPDFPADADCEKEAYYGAIVLNEGVWTQNNSSLDVFALDDDENACSKVFEVVNGMKLGDTANDLLLDEDTLYVVMNESKRIYKIQLPSLQLIGQLDLPSHASPRQMLIVSPQKAYLTSLLDSTLYVFNPSRMEWDGKHLTVENHMEGIAYVNDKAFIACGNYAFPATNNKLAVIHIPTDSLMGYIELPIENPGTVLTDGKDIFVNCRGNYAPSTQSAIIRLDPVTESIVQTSEVVGSLYQMNLAGDAIFALHDSGIVRYDILTADMQLSFIPKIEITDDAFDWLNGISVDWEREELYIFNARYGGVNGECVVFDPFGNELRRFETGLYPKEAVISH